MAVSSVDSAPDRQSEQAHDEIAERIARAAAAQRARVLSDVNATPARPEFDPATKRYVYETTPIPLARLFGSPLAQRGRYATGPGAERLVSSGWGDPRSNAYDRNVNLAARHMALDFVADFGENVLAAARGKVMFVGYQGRKPIGGVSVIGVHANDAREEILDSKGVVVASTALNNIGFGGIFVEVQHLDEFQGYKTGYFHLSNTHVAEGQVVEEGQLIGNIGGTGGYYNWFHKGTHLHFQVEFTSGGLRALVRPTAMVPNYWPGHADSTNANQANDIIMPLSAAAGVQIATSRAAAVLTGLNRATVMQNKGTAEVKQDQSDHAGQTARNLDVQRSALYASAAAFQGQAPVVTSPMTYDFDQGVWLVNGQENGVV